MAIRRVLILSASFGEGHRQASRAIKEELLQAYPDATAEIVDYIQSISPTWNKFAQFFYIQGIKRAPLLYGFFYKQFNRIPSDSTLSRSMSKISLIIGGNLFLEYLNTFKPDVVIHTFPSSASAHDTLLREGKTRVPSITVITDYAAHRQWIHSETSLYFVGAPKVADELIQEGVPQEKIRVTGIPVRQNFKQSYNREALLKKHGLDAERPTVLLLAGAFGVSERIRELMAFLLDYPLPLQVLIVTGRNRRLYEVMREQVESHQAAGFEGSFHRVKVYGFVDYIAELMAVSDLVFTKSGGLTTSEAVAMGVPMILFKPIPGQEKANADFLSDAGVAFVTQTMEEMVRLFDRWMHDAHLRQQTRANFVRLRRSMYQTTITKELEQFLKSTRLKTLDRS
ncbi:MAG: diglucosyldiacylglycerol synthase (LTA membrane anchor synthesis) [Candidatus Carbobacillus altaicus]|uniref:Diglucosyldiacylglycerol synthase (LTA membrane anchor synthesis) n=1 Tax=Candidatus Carbonibacillus altaicus TaxID=2163959 RepID=A0A2R6Y261_9BACL|nr:MAG: diglucosyldiacylglycerol synthase (LTA membrane anchor synthesis) [Candidatus Carbobacillus altaicus]